MVSLDLTVLQGLKFSRCIWEHCLKCRFPSNLKPSEITVAARPSLPLFWRGSAALTLGPMALVYNYLWVINTWIWLLHIHHSTPLAEILGRRASLPNNRAERLRNLKICRRAAFIIFFMSNVISGHLSLASVEGLKLITGPAYLAIDHKCLLTFLCFGYSFCPANFLEFSVQFCMEIILYWLLTVLTAFHTLPVCLPRAFLVFVLCTWFAHGLIHIFLCAVTTGSKIQRFYFQFRTLIVHVTLKPRNEKLTF